MNTAKELAVGIFVVLGLICVGYLAIKLGRMELLSGEGFQLTAKFNSVSGLRAGADVEMAGVPVGRVASITLDSKNSGVQALIVLRLNKDFHLSEDTIASIKTSGLIGDKYISLSPGGADKILKSGDEIEETESAVDLESLIGKYAFGGVK